MRVFAIVADTRTCLIKIIRESNPTLRISNAMGTVSRETRLQVFFLLSLIFRRFCNFKRPIREYLLHLPFDVSPSYAHIKAFNCKIFDIIDRRICVKICTLYSITLSLKLSYYFHLACNIRVHARMYYCEKENILWHCNIYQLQFIVDKSYFSQFSIE